MRGLVRHSLALSLLLPLLLPIAGCDSSPLEIDSFPLEESIWSNEEARFEIIDSGGTITFRCALGAIAETIIVRPGGTFDVSGTMATGPLAYPVRSARFRGRIAGETMTLTIEYTDTPEAFGTFELIKDFDSGVGYICVC